MNSFGYLQIQVITASGALPIKGAIVTVRDINNNILYTLKTDADGNTTRVKLGAPKKELTYDPGYGGTPYYLYSVEVDAEGYNTAIIRGIQIFDTISSQLPVEMKPLPATSTFSTIGIAPSTIEIPPNALIQEIERVPQGPKTEPRILERVYIPEYIVVHLGTPASDARNVRVKFIDYIKNVASSEIYPTWPVNSISANVHAQVSVALNRIFTEWYTSRGYNFNITNSTQYDQCFVEGRNIFDNINKIVDVIFNIYIRKANSMAPYFAQYCNGTTVVCAGMSQWGTVTLANQGNSPSDIIKHYYGNDAILDTTNDIRGLEESYPGRPLAIGDVGYNVRLIQTQLNRIRKNYPSIPQIFVVDSNFKADTKAAVSEFQRIFNLNQTGIVDKGTWYKISYIYTAVTKLAQLDSEAIQENIGKTPPTTVIREGSSGKLVKDLQFLLNYVADYYSSVPTVVETGVFDAQTKNAVIEFQKTFGLTQDGIVGSATWKKLYDIYNGILQNVDDPNKPSQNPPAINPPYPGYLLTVGTTGDAVKTMQSYLNVISNNYPSIPKLIADGVFGTQTKNAVIEFQKLFGLVPDGIIGRSTWNRIVEVYSTISQPSTPPYPGVLLKVGSSGDSVKLIQNYLNKIGTRYTSIPKLTADGAFGNQTKSAVIAFQNIFGLSPDGIVGKSTWDKIMQVYNSF